MSRQFRGVAGAADEAIVRRLPLGAFWPAARRPRPGGALGGEALVTLALWPDGACRGSQLAWEGPVEHTYSRHVPAPQPDPERLLTAYEDGVAAVCRIAAPLDRLGWAALTPCLEWRAFELAGHLHCVADDLHEYLDAAPVSRYARLMTTGADSDSLIRKLARQNAAELAALADAQPAEHIAAFAASARRYASRLPAVWDLPHHQYRDIVVTVGGMAGAACAEWHLHASDLAIAIGIGYRPADPAAIVAGWIAGMPHLPLAAPAGWLAAWHGRHADPWQVVLAASGRGATLPSAGREPGGERSWARWSARPLLRRKG